MLLAACPLPFPLRTPSGGCSLSLRWREGRSAGSGVPAASGPPSGEGAVRWWGGAISWSRPRLLSRCAPPPGDARSLFDGGWAPLRPEGARSMRWRPVACATAVAQQESGTSRRDVERKRQKRTNADSPTGGFRRGALAPSGAPWRNPARSLGVRTTRAPSGLGWGVGRGGLGGRRLRRRR